MGEGGRGGAPPLTPLTRHKRRPECTKQKLNTSSRAGEPLLVLFNVNQPADGEAFEERRDCLVAAGGFGKIKKINKAKEKKVVIRRHRGSGLVISPSRSERCVCLKYEITPAQSLEPNETFLLHFLISSRLRSLTEDAPPPPPHPFLPLVFRPVWLPKSSLKMPERLNHFDIIT